MINCSDLSLAIAGRPLLRDGAFNVGRGEKVALVGRNGTGKSSLISVIVKGPSPQLSFHGDVSITGSIGYLPQVPVAGGLGSEPSAFSHVISARALDVLDDELTSARRLMAEDPTHERITRFSEAEERYRLSGGYEIEATLGRMADGLGFPQELLFADVDSLSGGQRRRLDLIRVLFATPEVMVLDEPTNHLDAPAKRWLMEQLERFNG
ncbi:MAG: ATP-binding cassette domain-containing protein, partial [Acidimicrobiales bacterium]